LVARDGLQQRGSGPQRIGSGLQSRVSGRQAGYLHTHSGRPYLGPGRRELPMQTDSGWQKRGSGLHGKMFHLKHLALCCAAGAMHEIVCNRLVGWLGSAAMTLAAGAAFNRPTVAVQTENSDKRVKWQLPTNYFRDRITHVLAYRHVVRVAPMSPPFMRRRSLKCAGYASW